jgi:hypothetical protein
VVGLSRKTNPRATTRATRHVRMAAIGHALRGTCL